RRQRLGGVLHCVAASRYNSASVSGAGAGYYRRRCTCPIGWERRCSMTRQRRGVWLRASLAAVLVLSTPRALMQAQQTQYPRPSELPNPYRLAEHWPTLPKTMNEGRWGEVIRVHVDTTGHVWVFHRCFNVVPAGSATCLERGAANPPIL